MYMKKILNTKTTPANSSQILKGVRKKTATDFSLIKQADKNNDMKKPIIKIDTMNSLLNLNL